MTLNFFFYFMHIQATNYALVTNDLIRVQLVPFPGYRRSAIRMPECWSHCELCGERVAVRPSAS